MILVPLAFGARPFANRIETLIEGSAASVQAFWGIRVVNLADGSVVFSKNENHFFMPASNTKLFSTALALMRLGPDYRFHTIVSGDAAPDANGTLHGNLRLIGGGDPNLSARVLPYQQDAFTENPLQAMEELADQVVQRGVRRIERDVVGDDSAYVWDPYPVGWAADDAIWEYGAPVSALTLNDNAFTLWVRPALHVGEPAQLALSPRVEMTIHNRTRTVDIGEKKLDYKRIPGSHELIVSGVIPLQSPPEKTLLAVADPALFAAHALLDALERRGIAVGGEAAVRHRRVEDMSLDTSGVELARHDSLPLIEALRVIDKESQNLHAEMILREVARVKTGIGSRAAGLEEMRGFLSEVDIEPKQYNFEDGSGLSRLTLVTPLTISKLLAYMYASKYREDWVKLLPVAGEDGTLKKRFREAANTGLIHAKTGSLSHVTSLSGYMLPKPGKAYAFSILVNNYNGPTSEVRTILDKIAVLLMNGN